MFRHCVLFRWKPEVTDEQRATVARGLDELAELAVVQAYVHGPDAGLREDNWDYVVVADFETEDDYATYAADPGHVELIKSHIAPNIDARAAVQLDVPGG